MRTVFEVWTNEDEAGLNEMLGGYLKDRNNVYIKLMFQRRFDDRRFISPAERAAKVAEEEKRAAKESKMAEVEDRMRRAVEEKRVAEEEKKKAYKAAKEAEARIVLGRAEENDEQTEQEGGELE